MSAEQTATTTMSAARERGNKAFGVGNLAAALASYDEALTADQSDHLSLSNRALVLYKLSRFAEAAAAARKCTVIEPSFAKGHLRLSSALIQLMQQWGGPGVTSEFIKEARFALMTASRSLRAHDLLARARSASPDVPLGLIKTEETKLRADIGAIIARGLTLKVSYISSTT